MTAQTLPQIAARFIGAPLMISPDKAAVMAQVLGPRLGGVCLEAPAPDVAAHAPASQLSFSGDELHRQMTEEDRRGYSIRDGVAIIGVMGTTVRRGAWLGVNSGTTSYEGLSAQIRAAAADDRVAGIMLEIDSMGGEAAGCFELTAIIREARARKPVWALVACYALSAGYAIAAQADRIIATEDAQLGSIGVIMLHMDHSQALEAAGQKVTIIRSGAHKASGNPFEVLPEALRDEWQASGDRMRGRFAQEVELGRRNRLTLAGALATEAQVYEAQDAIRLGLADEITPAFEAHARFVAKLSGVDSTPATGAARAALSSAQSASLSEGKTMLDDKITNGAPAGALSSTSTAPASTPAPAPQAAAAPAGLSAADCGRITNAVARAGLSASFAGTLMAECASVEQALDRIIDQRADAAQASEPAGETRSASVVTYDAVDKARDGMALGIMARAGMAGGERNQYTGSSLMELGREMLNLRGATASMSGRMALAGAIFAPQMAGGMHGVSDFGNILADVANKAMLIGFEETEETFERFTSVGTMTDFKATKRVGLDAFPALPQVAAGGEFTYGTMGDHGETAILATYGKLFAISRQTLINDDLGAFTEVPRKMGRAARRTVGDLVYAVLTANAAMSDGVALFHADHGNLAGAAGLPSEATINAAIIAMAKQKDRSANATALNIAPAFGMFPVALRSAVLQALNSEYAPDDTAKVGTVKQGRAFNTVRDAFEPIFDARLDAASATAWYLAAAPGRADTIEVGYLDGNAAPFIDQQDGWSVDGTEFKVRIDAAATPLAWEGLYKNAGA